MSSTVKEVYHTRENFVTYSPITPSQHLCLQNDNGIQCRDAAKKGVIRSLISREAESVPAAVDFSTFENVDNRVFMLGKKIPEVPTFRHRFRPSEEQIISPINLLYFQTLQQRMRHMLADTERNRLENSETASHESQHSQKMRVGVCFLLKVVPNHQLDVQFKDFSKLFDSFSICSNDLLRIVGQGKWKDFTITGYYDLNCRQGFELEYCEISSSDVLARDDTKLFVNFPIGSSDLIQHSLYLDRNSGGWEGCSVIKIQL
ncbi:hypothetical protein BJ742DRAFT_868908 [Cladochytrium replicatum]|nr:hypothetical protein BJ742DRAFT_868908 [Cladochytrium replicatum]